ncbi:MAG: iron ABC transporter substrate-binding protein [Thermodesulfobacteriota bacterium]
MKQMRIGMIGVILAVLGIIGTVSADTVSVTDMAGRRIRAPLNPDRIICLGPGALRLIVYLQALDRVAGVEEMEKRHPHGRPYRVAHPDLVNLPRIGPGGPAAINKKPDLEAILAVNPEVIFVTYMEAALADEVQQTLGIPVVVLSYGESTTFDEAVFVSLKTAGAILDRAARAEAVIDYIQTLRKDLRGRTADIPKSERPSAYVGGIGHRGAQGIESTEQYYFPLDWIHAENAAEAVKSRIGGHLFVDKETILALDPEVIFVDGGGSDLVAADYRKKPSFYQSLKAFQTRRIYGLLPFNYYATNIGTAVTDAYAMGKVLYPERFKDINPTQKADEIYTFLVGKPVYTQMEAAFGPIGQPMPFSD